MHKTHERTCAGHHSQQKIPRPYLLPYSVPIDAIENQTRRETKGDSSHIYYYFGVSEDFPQFVLLIYMFK